MSSSDGPYDGMLEGSTLIVPLGSTDGKDLGLCEGVLIVSSVDEVLGFTLGATGDTDPGFIYGFFGGSNYGKPVGLLLGDSLG